MNKSFLSLSLLAAGLISSASSSALAAQKETFKCEVHLKYIDESGRTVDKVTYGEKRSGDFAEGEMTMLQRHIFEADLTYMARLDGYALRLDLGTIEQHCPSGCLEFKIFSSTSAHLVPGEPLSFSFYPKTPLKSVKGWPPVKITCGVE